MSRYFCQPVMYCSRILEAFQPDSQKHAVGHRHGCHALNEPDLRGTEASSSIASSGNFLFNTELGIQRGLKKHVFYELRKLPFQQFENIVWPGLLPSELFLPKVLWWTSQNWYLLLEKSPSKIHHSFYYNSSRQIQGKLLRCGQTVSRASLPDLISFEA